jgi:hypothetical protein
MAHASASPWHQLGDEEKPTRHPERSFGFAKGSRRTSNYSWAEVVGEKPVAKLTAFAPKK